MVSIALWLQFTCLIIALSRKCAILQRHLTLVHWVQCTSMIYAVTWSESNRAVLGCGKTGDSHHGKSTVIISYNHINMDHNLEHFVPQSTVCSKSSISMDFLINWPVGVYTNESRKLISSSSSSSSKIYTVQNPLKFPSARQIFASFPKYSWVWN